MAENSPLENFLVKTRATEGGNGWNRKKILLAMKRKMGVIHRLRWELQHSLYTVEIVS